MKKIGVFGTGMVGNAIATKLVQLGYEVMMGSRTPDNEKALAWAKQQGNNASTGTFASAAAFGDIVFNCTQGDVSLEVMKQAGNENLRNKILIDVSNPLLFEPGKRPALMPGLCNTNSLGESIQQFLPDTHVVKTLNIVNCEVMVNASKCGGDATMLLAGNNTTAKASVTELLQQFGWNDIIDMGDITHARSSEMMLPVWLSVYGATKKGFVAFKMVR
ncbi:NAD(P)-binding domain-containing protein [Pseudoflavitalea sp. G-6-1-2]|uniref:NADPH-dependent F420 reductase n=1 Tax=Pseudoflavitalea sp. G-6-1-2 TaxID=2728841 RepID=UPI00146C6E84|nr:NAD(P)-binding domain-containing protein [Pseudoflavitalea sp. G-6-1-2]NML23543.1 NAD(P)-binding domain-containing protein [Pseudoflavitalea sp. G-6-1-2]